MKDRVIVEPYVANLAVYSGFSIIMGQYYDDMQKVANKHSYWLTASKERTCVEKGTGTSPHYNR